MSACRVVPGHDRHPQASTAKVPTAPAPTCEAAWDYVPQDCHWPAVARALIGGTPTWVCGHHAEPGDLPLAQVSHLL